MLHWVDAVERAHDDGVTDVLRHVPAKIGRHSPLTDSFEAIDPLLSHKLAFAGFHGYWPSIREPRSFSEKVYHRKYCTDHDEYAMLADKHAVREFVRKRVGDDVLADLYHVTDDPTTIPFDSLPDSFVVKSTHGSGDVRLVDNGAVDPAAIREQCATWLTAPSSEFVGEYWYDRIDPQIIVEEYIDASGHRAPRDYKFYVFDGRVQSVHVDIDRFDEDDLTRRFYDREWNSLDFTVKRELGPVAERPSGFERMRTVAESLGEGLDFARIDLYNPQGEEVRFGEITLSPGAGRTSFSPTKRDFQLGQYWDVYPPRVEFRSQRSTADRRPPR